MINHLLPDLSIRSDQKEIMEDPDCDPAFLVRTLNQFKWINILVSRYRWLIKRYIVSDMYHYPDKEYNFLDVGSGGCDMARWLVNYCTSRNLKIKITCIDTDPRTISYATMSCKNIPEIEIIQSDAFDIKSLGKRFDYIFANHLFHHLSDNEVLLMTKTFYDNSERLFLISDLLRSKLSYLLFSVSVKFLFRHSFIYEDGKLSIKRGFTKAELNTLMNKLNSSIPINIKYICPGRFYLICDKTQTPIQT